MIDKVKTFGKFLDQPMLISKLDKAMPLIMATGGLVAYSKIAKDTFQKGKEENIPKEEVKKDVIKKGIMLATSIASALLAPHIAGKAFNRTPIDSIATVKEKNKNLVDNFVKNNELKEDTVQILNKAKEKILSFKEVNKLSKNLKFKEGNEFMEKLIPDPQNIKASDIFQEIGFLSLYGAVPVLGGVVGGVAADKAVGDDYKSNINDKINEGIFQYLANIFMCNIGAGAALGILEKMKITSKTARAIGMTTGIILTGVLSGAKIANFISQKVINPIFSPKKKMEERKTEPMDLCLHTDDIATVSLLSGLKWIEPALPILYSVSGYKTGVGYRN